MEEKRVPENGNGCCKRKSWKKSLLMGVLCLAMVFMMPTSAVWAGTNSAKTTSAATKKKKAIAKKRKKAISAYQKLLKKKYSGMSIAKFMLLDIDRNGIPELVTRLDGTGLGAPYAIFAYRNGKADCVWNTSSYPQGLYYYPFAKVICGINEIMPRFTGGKYGGKDVSYAKMSKTTGELKTLAEMTYLEALESGQKDEYRYTICEKAVSRAKYKRYVKKLIGKAKRTDLSKRLLDNTTANRRKYLK